LFGIAKQNTTGQGGHELNKTAERKTHLSNQLLLFIHGTPNKVMGFIKRHVLIGTCLAIFLVYFLYEVVTAYVVVCRDAYVTADIVFIAPEVSGPMLARQVSDDQQVSKGTLLFSIDPQPFQIELDSRNAALNLAKANLTRAQDRLALTRSDIEAKQASFDEASKNRERGLELLKEHVVSQETVDNLERSFQVAQAALEQSRTAKVVAEQDVAVQSAEVKQVGTAVAKAEWELNRTQVRSPVSGRIAPFQLRPGTYLEAGKSVLAVITSDNWRVVANLTERHLSGLKVGREVWFSIGSQPWQIHVGHIRSIAPGVARSATSSNALPYVEPTTEWIRLPRRFPVEIDLGDLPEENRLFMGANATVWWINR
jgi:membrane fusion protein, multidrug efflux system